MGLVLLLLIPLALYFFMIRPQQRRVRERETLISSLDVGDEVVTVGGLLGRIVDFQDDVVVLSLGQNHQVRVLRRAISGRQSELEPPEDDDDVVDEDLDE